MEPHNLHKDQIVLSKRQVSMIMASMILVCLFVFICGFFLGKRTVIDDFSSNVTQNTLHDQIDYLLTTQSLQSSIQDNAIDQPDDQSVIIESLSGPAQSSVPSQDNNVPDVAPNLMIKNNTSISLVVDQKIQTVKKEDSFDKDSNLDATDVDKKDPQYACLIGFGTKKAAHLFVARLKKHHVPVILKTVISKTATGQTRTWYQAITPTYDTAQELQEIIKKVLRYEHIREHDIKIVHTN